MNQSSNEKAPQGFFLKSDYWKIISTLVVDILRTDSF